MLGSTPAATARVPLRSAPGQASVPAATGILAGLASTRTTGSHEILFHEGDPADALFEVARGVVRLYRLLPDGRRAVTGFAFPGGILGLSFRDVHICTAETITSCELRRCERNVAARVMESGPDFRRRLLSLVSDELCAAQDQMVLLGRKTAPERIVSFLLWVAAKSSDEDGSRHVDLPMSRADIADYLGLTTETVSREMTKLKNAKLISLPTPQRVQFLRIDLLREIAENREPETRTVTGRLKAARWPS